MSDVYGGFAKGMPKKLVNSPLVEPMNLFGPCININRMSRKRQSPTALSSQTTGRVTRVRPAKIIEIKPNPVNMTLMFAGCLEKRGGYVHLT